MDEDFKILGLEPGASVEEARQAYKDLVNVWHPDRFSHDPRLQKKAQEKLKKINEAYERLHHWFESHQATPPSPSTFQEKRGSADAPAPARETRDSTHHISTWMWPLIVAVVIFAVYEGIMKKSEFTPAAGVPTQTLQISIPHEAKLPSPLKTQSFPLTPEEILARKRKEAEKWGSRTYGSAGSRPVGPRIGRGLSYITVGSMKEDVIRLQGTPDSSAANLFTYGQSHIYFEDDRVTGWDNRTPHLNVRLKPSSRTAATTFTVGSTKDDVLSTQGTPDSFTDNEFTYGDSNVHFKNDRVTSWYDPHSHLKVRMQPSRDQ